MPVDARLVRNSVLPDGEWLAPAVRLRAAAEEVDDVGRTLRRSAASAGLVGPAGDALAALVGDLAGELSDCANALRGAATGLLTDVVGTATGPWR